MMILECTWQSPVTVQPAEFSILGHSGYGSIPSPTTAGVDRSTRFSTGWLGVSTVAIMLTRFHADNLFCFVDFAFTPGKFTVLAGQPGSGRSSLFFLLHELDFMLRPGRDELKIWDDFTPDLCTAWQEQSTHSLAADIELEGERYTYRATVARGDDYLDTRLVSEELLCQDQPLFTCVDDAGQLHDPDQSFSRMFTTDGTRSLVSRAIKDTKSARLHKFSEWWKNRLFIGLPSTDETFGIVEEWTSWYRRVAREEPQRIDAFEEDLRRHLPRFVRFAPPDDTSDDIRPIFKAPRSAAADESDGYSFEYLSTRERVLMQLYALAHLAMRPGHTLCIDSPRFNVATSVLRDWLQFLMQRAEETSTQVLVIVDDPDVIAELPAGIVQYFERPDDGAVVVKTTKT